METASYRQWPLMLHALNSEIPTIFMMLPTDLTSMDSLGPYILILYNHTRRLRRQRKLSHGPPAK